MGRLVGLVNGCEVGRLDGAVVGLDVGWLEEGRLVGIAEGGGEP